MPPGPSGDPVHGAFALEIALASDLRRILYLSTIGVYGDWGGAWVDEASETRTTSPRGRWRLAAEAAMAGARRGAASPSTSSASPASTGLAATRW